MMSSEQRRLRFFGMQRSGNHAIIHWVRRNLGLEDSLFFNNCGIGDAVSGFAQVEVGEKKFGPAFRNRPAYQDVKKSVKSVPNLLVSYENRSLKAARRSDEFTLINGEKLTWNDVHIQRSFLNWLASFLKLRVLSLEPGSPKRFQGLDVVTHVACYIENLKIARRHGYTIVNYDEWLTNSLYRERVLADLGITLCETSIGERRFYGGSSFEGTSPAVSVDSQLRRWEHLIEDDLFLSLVTLCAWDQNFISDLADHYPQDAAFLEAYREDRQSALQRFITGAGGSISIGQEAG